MNKGKFIVLEGIDFSGKSTIANKLLIMLKGSGYRVELVNLPSENPIGSFTRNVVLNDRNTKVSSNVSSLLMGASITEEVEKNILPKLALGVVVIANRYTPSLRVYQRDSQFSTPVADAIDALLTPDLVLHLDIDSITYQHRRDARSQLDKLENVTDIEVKQRTDAYRELTKRHDYYRTINGNQDLSKVTIDCINEVLSIL